MNVKEFKEKYPHLAHLEGEELWNAMEDDFVLENGAEIIDLNSPEGQQKINDFFTTSKHIGENSEDKFGLFIPMGMINDKDGKEMPAIQYKENNNGNK